jgi:hypothetical protein
MFPFDPFWIYFIVPAVMVSVLILIKITQERMNKHMAKLFGKEEGQKETTQDHTKASGEIRTEIEEKEVEPNASQRTRPDGCPNYLGYLYMRKAPGRAHVPTECYNCRELLKCLYSPVVLEKVYGESGERTSS